MYHTLCNTYSSKRHICICSVLFTLASYIKIHNCKCKYYLGHYTDLHKVKIVILFQCIRSKTLDLAVHLWFGKYWRMLRVTTCEALSCRACSSLPGWSWTGWRQVTQPTRRHQCMQHDSGKAMREPVIETNMSSSYSSVIIFESTEKGCFHVQWKALN